MLNRRSFLRLTAATGVASWISGCSSESNPLLEAGQPSFSEPDVVFSIGGRLELTLRAAPTEVPWGDGSRQAFTYNGSTPGPTLRVRAGDQVVIHLENALDESTNLHTHGLHVSPEGQGDNIFATVDPGESRTYIYDIPSDHRSGLFWYHPHVHGSVARQVAAGLAGAIVVIDETDAITELTASSERIWVLSDPPIATSSAAFDASPMDQMMGREGDAILVNGTENPDITAEAGSLERWRIVNASASRYYRLALDDHEVHLISSDGGRLMAPTAATELLLAPGERSELLVAPTTDGSYSVRALPYDRGGMGMGMGMGSMMGDSSLASEAVIATLTVQGTRAPAPLPSELARSEGVVRPAAGASRILELGMGMGMGMGMGTMTGEGSMMSFTINGTTFDPERTDIHVRAGSVEKWEIHNTTPMDHPFHLHVWPFTVDGAESGWKDTVNVPARESVTITIPFVGIVGRSVYHCHILDHEDLGMMGTIDVTV